jgi:hypoxanthine phosphoribosyltransferase
MARQIECDYQGKPLAVVGVLENCFMFMADLVRQIKSPVACQFVRAEIHDEASAGGAEVRTIHYIPKFEATGKDVLLVDGILQSGVTLDHLVRALELQGARSVRTATLIEKTDELTTDVRRDYVGFKTRGKFLVGYGLSDRSGDYRNLPYVAARK